MEVGYRSVGNCREQFRGARSKSGGWFLGWREPGAGLEGVLLKADPYHRRLQVPVPCMLKSPLQRDDLELCSTLLQLSLAFVPAVRVKARPSPACTG